MNVILVDNLRAQGRIQEEVDSNGIGVHISHLIFTKFPWFSIHYNSMAARTLHAAISNKVVEKLLLDPILVNNNSISVSRVYCAVSRSRKIDETL